MGVRHAWSVIAEKAFRDEATGQLSLNLIEGITLRGTFPDPIPVGAAVPAQLHLESAWYVERLDDTQRKTHGRISLLIGTEPVGMQEFDAEVPTGVRVARTKLSFSALPLANDVLYFVVEQQVGADFREVARLPLVLTIDRVTIAEARREMLGLPRTSG